MLPKNANGELIESKIDYLETWKGMEECFRQGLTRSIGISNFNSEQIVRLLESAEIAPVNNQVLCFKLSRSRVCCGGVYTHRRSIARN
jgi:aldehyde reductase